MVNVVAAVMKDIRGRVLVCQRRPDQKFANKWEFPGGKVEDGETPREALVRELKEELQISNAEVGEEIIGYFYRYENGDEFHLMFFRVEHPGVELEPHQIGQFQSISWSPVDHLRHMDFLDGDKRCIEKLNQRLMAQHTITLEPEEKQSVILALARLAIERPGWRLHLRIIAKKMYEAEMFDELFAMGDRLELKEQRRG